MQGLIITSLVSLLFFPLLETYARPCCSCLPKGVEKTDIVHYLAVKPAVQDQPERLDDRKAVTVAEKLGQLKARCRKGRLVARSGKPIYFFQLSGCWGNPPEDYQEILAKQAQELARLRKRYTVIEMTCNPSGERIP